jgi:ribonuclease HII
MDEKERLELMKEFEYKYSDYKYICGIDEAGRGPLAGPVVAAAVILPKDTEILYLNDSKKLSEKKRNLLYDEIISKAISFGVGITGVEDIEKLNILGATYKAMREAISKLSAVPDILLNDAVIIPELEQIKQVGIIKGDAKSISIAAASIIAKVTRDRLMIDYDKEFPKYGFAKHKGYGTKAHIEAIRENGMCKIHRKGFVKSALSKKKVE